MNTPKVEQKPGLSQEIGKLKFDKRLMEWHVNRGLLSKADMQAHLAALTDLASNVEPVNLGLADTGYDSSHS